MYCRNADKTDQITTSFNQPKQPLTTKEVVSFFAAKPQQKKLWFFSVLQILYLFEFVCQSVFLRVCVQNVMLTESSFMADIVYGFVCLLIFQVRVYPDLFFNLIACKKKYGKLCACT